MKIPCGYYRLCKYFINCYLKDLGLNLVFLFLVESNYYKSVTWHWKLDFWYDYILPTACYV